MHRRIQCLPKTYKFTKLIVTPQIQFQSLETSSEEEEFKDKNMANKSKVYIDNPTFIHYNMLVIIHLGYDNL